MLQYGYFAHTSSITGLAFNELAKTFGWNSNTFGENIWMTGMSISGANASKEIAAFKANITAQSIFTAWVNSPGHKANILNASYNKIGVGIAFSNTGKAYATQAFSN